MSRLRDQIRRSIDLSANGISFADFMEMALYDPEEGYYATPRVLGREGDFYTSVSAGSCFGMLLARQIRQIFEKMGSPEGFMVFEQGAHDGQLALDVTGHLPGEIACSILERVPAYVEAQRQKLGERVQIVETPDSSAPAGVFLCNELMDAFPVHRVVWKGGQWQELRVVLAGEDDAFREESFPLDEALLSLLPNESPKEEGHILEVCPGLEAWVRGLDRLFERGIAILIDYGMAESDLLEPERRDGTLRCYRQHRAVDDPFEEIGNTDITFQVNFTQVEAAARRCGWEVLANLDQGRFLTGVAASWLKEVERAGPAPGTAALIRQFQTLTHPGNMGRVFRVLVLGRGDVPTDLYGLTWS